MAVVINFVIDKFVWFMCGAIIIILAIIGGYADKTNFGEGKKIVKVKKKDKDIIDSLEVKENPETKELVNTQGNPEIKESANTQEDLKTPDNTNNEIKVESSAPITSDTELKNESPTINLEENKQEKQEKEIEEKKDVSVIDEIIEENKKTTEELDELLPKKDVLDDDIFQDLGDLDDISFNSKKEIIKDIPDLDDVSLPDITKKKKNSKQIWKK